MRFYDSAVKVLVKVTDCVICLNNYAQTIKSAHIKFIGIWSTNLAWSWYE